MLTLHRPTSEIIKGLGEHTQAHHVWRPLKDRYKIMSKFSTLARTTIIRKPHTQRNTCVIEYLTLRRYSPIS